VAGAAVVAVCVGVPLAGTALTYLWGRRMALRVAAEPPAADALADGATLKGRVGRTATPMRPSGSVVFDGRRVDALTEGMMLDAGTWVRCVDVRGGRVIVRQIAKPPDLNEIDLDDLK
jgi:membrane-bound serine protease (ClpP class)